MSPAKYQIEIPNLLFKYSSKRQPDSLMERSLGPCPLLGGLVDPASRVVQDHAGGAQQGRVHQIRNHHVHVLH